MHCGRLPEHEFRSEPGPFLHSFAPAPQSTEDPFTLFSSAVIQSLLCLSSAECVADDGLSLGRRCLITRPFVTNLVAHDLHLNGVAREIQVHHVLLQANRHRIAGGQCRRQIIKFGLVTPNVNVAVQLDRNVVDIVMGLQWCTNRISTCSYGRGRHVLFLDVDDCALLGLFGLTDCVSNRHSADDCENADTQTELHTLLLRQYKAIQLPRVARSRCFASVESSVSLSAPTLSGV